MKFTVIASAASLFMSSVLAADNDTETSSAADSPAFLTFTDTSATPGPNLLGGDSSTETATGTDAGSSTASNSSSGAAVAHVQSSSFVGVSALIAGCLLAIL